jgi:hypothetical protein
MTISSRSGAGGARARLAPVNDPTMDPAAIVTGLARNRAVFHHLLASRSADAQRWRPAANKWSRLDIVCHLYDEERDDFRTRVRHALETPDRPPPEIDPEGWVTSREYAAQDYEAKLAAFLAERETSVAWLRSLGSPQWDRAWTHPHLGPMSAGLFLANWLAHDYLHLRQIIRYDYHELKERSGQDLRYAGEW